ncbi:MAG TPA: aminotransferase, partial [Hyphomicrobiaceae bacterium]|nr:aminotransferase [Hyphomicrobiaceae bacterium]
MGERDHIISLEMASVGMELAGRWGADAISKRLAHLTGRIADGLGELPVAVPDDRFRAPHILCIRLVKDELPGVVEALAREKIHVAPRLGRMRISPHVYNTLGDADRLVGALGRILK